MFIYSWAKKFEANMPYTKKSSTRAKNAATQRWKEVENAKTANCSSTQQQFVIFQDDPKKEDGSEEFGAMDEPCLRIQQKKEQADKDIPVPFNKGSEVILLDFDQLSPLLTKVKCADCNGNSMVFDLSSAHDGFSRKISLKCPDCELNGFDAEKISINNSKRVKTGEATGVYDLNIRMSLAFVYIGKGYAAMEQFSSIMNMSSVSKTTFYLHEKILEKGVEKATEVIMNECRSKVKKAYQEMNLLEKGQDQSFDDGSNKENQDRSFDEGSNKENQEGGKVYADETRGFCQLKLN